AGPDPVSRSVPRTVPPPESPHGTPPTRKGSRNSMRGKRYGLGLSLAAGTLAVCGLAFAPAAAAVAPGSATVNADCGTWGGGDATLTATQNGRSEEHTSELQSRENLVCRLLL